MAWLDLTTLLSVGLLAFAGRRSRWTGRLLTLLLLSPGLRYLSTLFSFPIRLQLSVWAGDLLRLSGLDVVTEGNVLIRNDASGAPVEMAVDPACMGLQMTGVSLLMALFFLIWYEKQTRRAVPLPWVLVYGAAAFGLTILSNLFRIVLLVLFGAMPGTIAHEIIGLVCVATYAWLPAWGLARGWVRWFGRIAEELPANRLISVKSAGWGLGVLVVGLGVMAFAARPNPPTVDLCAMVNAGRFGGSGYTADCRCKSLPNGFVQLTKPGVLIYLKPQPDWFSADHSPMACWRGSGYDLRRVRETTLDNHRAYVGELRKRGKTLYTAWWFSNGRVSTISQFDLRGRMLRGEMGFALVNVTVEQRSMLSRPVR